MKSSISFFTIFLLVLFASGSVNAQQECYIHCTDNRGIIKDEFLPTDSVCGIGQFNLYDYDCSSVGEECSGSVDLYTVHREGWTGDVGQPLMDWSDGIESVTAARMGLKTTRYPDDIAWAVEAEVKAYDIGKPDMFEYYLGSHSPGWKSTYSPAGGDSATLGVYVRRHGRDVSIFFNKWLERFAKLKGYETDDIEIINKYTGGDPIATIPKQLITDGFMVTGGAAGQSGIGYGMRAGRICGEVAAAAVLKGDVSVKQLRIYPRRWKREFINEYRVGRIGLETVRKMTDREINTVILVFAGEDLSNLKGTPVIQAIKTAVFITRHKPSALWAYRALLRRN